MSFRTQVRGEQVQDKSLNLDDVEVIGNSVTRGPNGEIEFTGTGGDSNGVLSRCITSTLLISTNVDLIRNEEICIEIGGELQVDQDGRVFINE